MLSGNKCRHALVILHKECAFGSVFFCANRLVHCFLCFVLYFSRISFWDVVFSFFTLSLLCRLLSAGLQGCSLMSGRPFFGRGNLASYRTRVRRTRYPTHKHIHVFKDHPCLVDTLVCFFTCLFVLHLQAFLCIGARKPEESHFEAPQTSVWLPWRMPSGQEEMMKAEVYEMMRRGLIPQQTINDDVHQMRGEVDAAFHSQDTGLRQHAPTKLIRSIFSNRPWTVSEQDCQEKRGKLSSKTRVKKMPLDQSHKYSANQHTTTETLSCSGKQSLQKSNGSE